MTLSISNREPADSRTFRLHRSCAVALRAGLHSKRFASMLISIAWFLHRFQNNTFFFLLQILLNQQQQTHSVAFVEQNVLFSILLLRIFFQTCFVVSILVLHEVTRVLTTFNRSRKQKFLPGSVFPASVMQKPISSHFKNLMMIGLFSWDMSKSGTER